MKKWQIVLLVLLLGLSTVYLFLISQDSTEINDKPSIKNVLIITLDTTRPDHLGSYGHTANTSPNIDKLAQNGILFENAYSPVPLTLPSHCSIFTGLYPYTHGVRNNGNYKLSTKAETLAKILKKKGFTTAAFVSSFTVDSRFGIAQGFDHYDDKLSKDGKLKQFGSERNAKDTSEACFTWLNNNYEKPFFVWLHFFDAHFPYAPPQPFKDKFKNPYDGEIATMDYQIGKLLSLLKELNIRKNTLIIIAGDHGEAFGEHKEMGHQIFGYEENIRVPLIFNIPGIKKTGSRNSQRVSLIDIMPTVLNTLKLDIPSHIQGQDLSPIFNGEQIAEQNIYFESVFPSELMGCAPVKGIISNNYKLIKVPRGELFDLSKDPVEMVNLYKPNSRKVKKLKHQLFSHLNAKPAYFTKQRKINASEKKQLATLGYLSASSSAKSKKSNIDAKDRVEAYLYFSKGNNALAAGELTIAQKAYQRAIEMKLHIAPVYAKLAMVYKKQGKTREAEELLLEAIKYDKNDVGLKLDYAGLLIKTNRHLRAKEFLNSIDKNDRIAFDAEIQVLLGSISEIQKEYKTAIIHYNNALAIEPSNTLLIKKLINLNYKFENLDNIIILYLKLESLKPDEIGIIKGLAVLYGQVGKFSQSEKYFKKAFGLSNNPMLFFDQAVILSLKKDYKSAIISIKRFIELSKDSHPQKKLAKKLLKEYQRLLNFKKK